MTAVQAVYDGQVFIPEVPCNIIRGAKVSLIIETAMSDISEKQNKLAAFKQLTDNIIALNKTDPLPPQFDEIVSQRLHSCY